MFCSECGTKNDGDGRFCKQCGRPMPRTPKTTLAQVQAQVEKLIQEAFDLYQEHRYEEALLACEGVLALDPENVSALSLQGLVHEKRGQVPLAIEAFERVVQLNPYSVADRAKLEALKGNHATLLPPPSQPSLKWQILLEILPGLTAGVIAALMLAFGLWLTFRMSGTFTTAPASQPTPQNVASSPSQPPKTEVPPPGEPAQTTTTLPPPSSPQTTLAPLTMAPSQVALVPRESRSREQGTGNGRATSTPNDQTPQENTTVVMPDVNVSESQSPQPVYDIRVSRPSSPKQGESSNAESAEVYLQIARDAQRASNYQQAIAAYEKAAPLVRSPGDIYQQIAICYYRLGDKQSAARYYRLAIEQFRLQIQQGYEAEYARTAIQSCEMGLALCNQ